LRPIMIDVSKYDPASFSWSEEGELHIDATRLTEMVAADAGVTYSEELERSVLIALKHAWERMMPHVRTKYIKDRTR
jgi:hypothetical protein